MQIPLSRLRFGHEIGINMRGPYEVDDELKRLAATIVARGLINPLSVVWREGEPGDETEPTYYVAAGGRRLAALQWLARIGDYSWDEPVACEEFKIDDAGALELSVIENLERVPVHPVDAYEAFAKLADSGQPAAMIAARFGIPEREVRQRLALGRVAPKIREAWRGGLIGAEVAQAYTIVEDPALQEATFTALQAKGQIWAHNVRDALDVKVGAGAFKFVGEAAYIEAGGRLNHDLFSNEVFVLDEPILNALVVQKIDQLCKALVADGWKWAEPMPGMPGDAHRWERAEPEVVLTDEEAFAFSEASNDVDTDAGRARRQAITRAALERVYTPEIRATCGVFVGVTHQGEPNLMRGYIRPGEASPKAPQAADDGEAAAGPTKEPSAVLDAVRAGQTLAWAEVVGDYPAMAMELFLATWLAGPGCGSPLCISFGGAPGLERFKEWVVGDAHPQPSFAEALAVIQEMQRGLRDRLFATIVATSLDMTTAALVGAWNSKNVTAAGVEALGKAYTTPNVLVSLRQQFDAAGYFDGAKKSHALVCIEECAGEDALKKWAGAKKAEAAMFATELANQKGWLPPMLRTPGYKIASIMDAAVSVNENIKAARATRKAAKVEG